MALPPTSPVRVMTFLEMVSVRRPAFHCRARAPSMLKRDADRLRVTDKGMPVLEAILRELVLA